MLLRLFKTLSMFVIAVLFSNVSHARSEHTVQSKWQLVWQDEFSASSLNQAYWNIEINCDGGGNHEQQCYTDSSENLFLRDGSLHIVAHKAPAIADKPYTSARINSKGKVDFKYGRIEARAKLPWGQGAWPAIWMLPTAQAYGTWPLSGEIDIMESVNLKVALDDGQSENRVHGTLHYGHPWPNNVYSGKAYTFPELSNPADQFYVYAVEWEQDEIRWYVDDVLYARQQRTQFDSAGNVTHQGWYTLLNDEQTNSQKLTYTSAPFDDYFHLILNFAVGGNWPENTGQKGVDDAVFGDNNSFIIDYVRVYQCPLDKVTGKGCANVNLSKAQFDALLVTGKAPKIIPQ